MARRDAFRAERAICGGVSRYLQAPQRFGRDIEPHATTRAVDQHRRANDFAARRSYRIERLLHRTASRHDVVDDQDTLARAKREAAAKLAATCRLAALRIDGSHAKLPCDLVREDDPACGRTRDRLDIERPPPRRKGRAKTLRLGRMLKHLELLQIQR